MLNALLKAVAESQKAQQKPSGMPTFSPPQAMTPSMPAQPAPAPPDLSGLATQRRNLMDQSFQAPETQSMGRNDGLRLMLGIIAAKIAGVKNRDINQGAEGFLGARRMQVDESNQKAVRKAEMGSRRAMAEADMVGDEINLKNRQYEYERGRFDENERDIRNFDQQKQILKAQQEFTAKQKDEDRKLKMASQPFQLLKQNSKMWTDRINQIQDPAAKAEGLALIAQNEAAFLGDAPPLMPEQAQRLRELLSSQTFTEEGKDLANQKATIELEWLDKEKQQDFDYKTLMIAGKETANKLKALDLKHYPENLRFKRWLMSLQGQNLQSTIQNRNWHQFFDTNKLEIDSANKQVEFWDDYIKDLNKREAAELKDAGVLGAARVQTKFQMERARATQKRNEAVSAVPDPFEGGGVGGIAPNDPNNMFAPELGVEGMRVDSSQIGTVAPSARRIGGSVLGGTAPKGKAPAKTQPARPGWKRGGK